MWACEDVYTVRYISADHLGSTRLVTDESGSVVEQFDYLPYGEMCQNSTYPVAVHEKTDYLYTGKELQQFFGIDWYDSKARFQTTSGVFTSPDPLAEEYYPLSPYAYCAGDPVNRIDPKGKNPIVSALLGMAIDYSFQVYENYQKGYSGKEAWINQVDFADVGFSAINPGGKFKTVGTFAVNAAKEFVKVNLNEGFSFEDKNGSVVNVAVNSAIDLAVGKAVDTMEKLANNFSEEAKRALKDATHKQNLSTNRPESTRRASQAMAAESAVQPAIYTAQAYDVIYHVIDDFQEPLRRGISLVYEQKTDKQR